MRGSKNAIKFLKIIVFQSVKNFLCLGDLLSIQLMFLQLNVNLFSQKVVLEH